MGVWSGSITVFKNQTAPSNLNYKHEANKSYDLYNLIRISQFCFCSKVLILDLGSFALLGGFSQTMK